MFPAEGALLVKDVGAGWLFDQYCKRTTVEPGSQARREETGKNAGQAAFLAGRLFAATAG